MTSERTPGGIGSNLVCGPGDLNNRAEQFARLRHKQPVKYRISNPEIYREAKRGLPLEDGDERVTVDPFTGIVNIFSFGKTSEYDEKSGLPIVLRIASRQETIGVAIRKAVHIIEETEQGDKEGEGKLKIPERTLRLIDFTQTLYDGFTDKTITTENLTRIREQTEEEISSLGFKDTSNFFIQRALIKIRKALSYDSKNRFNPLISRSRLSSAKKVLYEFGMLTDDILRKYNYLGLDLLYQEREKEIESVQEVLDMAESILDNPSDFWTKRSQLEELTFKNLHPEQIRCAPYRLPAFWFMVYMFGFPKRNKQETQDLRNLFQRMFDPNSTIQAIDKIHKTKFKTREEVNNDFLERLGIGIKGLRGVLLKGDQELPF